MLLAKALGKENSLIIHHCSAHRDQLVFQKSMELHTDFVTLEKEVNSVYKVCKIILKSGYEDIENLLLITYLTLALLVEIKI